MKKTNHSRYNLSKGVTIGALGNPIVYTPSRGSLIIDEDTHHFLLQVDQQLDANINISDDETHRSLLFLMEYGILEKSTIEGSTEPNQSITTYKPSLTDLNIKKNFNFFTKILNVIGGIVSKVFNISFLSIGVVLCIVNIIFWLVFSSANNDVILLWVLHPIIFITTVIPIAFINILFHEAGHYAGALVCGIKPKAGLGLYFNGPVAYVDLTPLDTAPKKNRVMADLAGIAMDGYSLMTIGILSLLFHSNLLKAFAVSIAMACLSSLFLSAKSDFYWALKDIFDGRSVTATWATPKLLFNTLKNETQGRRFVIILIASYAIIMTCYFLIFFQWLFDIYHVIVKISPLQLLPAMVSFLLFTVVLLYLFMIRR